MKFIIKSIIHKYFRIWFENEIKDYAQRGFMNGYSKGWEDCYVKHVNHNDNSIPIECYDYNKLMEYLNGE